MYTQLVELGSASYRDLETIAVKTAKQEDMFDT